MTEKVLKDLEELEATFSSLAVALDQLKAALEVDEDDSVNDAMDAFPTPRQLASALEKLGKLIEKRPWESKRKKNG